ncbi:hypothetical protein EVAR_40486_1 [Eumeta japonica]|uniref:Uncharacterized protein n=1 Tax=Eumeta variegata TaxID=151549 RepID=A0A4C1XZW8_EUMVA|nr:hypothetical protein EVAR_40486_1 [Eumeta japonica]
MSCTRVLVRRGCRCTVTLINCLQYETIRTAVTHFISIIDRSCSRPTKVVSIQRLIYKRDGDVEKKAARGGAAEEPDTRNGTEGGASARRRRNTVAFLATRVGLGTRQPEGHECDRNAMRTRCGRRYGAGRSERGGGPVFTIRKPARLRHRQMPKFEGLNSELSGSGLSPYRETLQIECTFYKTAQIKYNVSPS